MAECVWVESESEISPTTNVALVREDVGQPHKLLEKGEDDDIVILYERVPKTNDAQHEFSACTSIVLVKDTDEVTENTNDRSIDREKIEDVNVLYESVPSTEHGQNEFSPHTAIKVVQDIQNTGSGSKDIGHVNVLYERVPGTVLSDRVFGSGDRQKDIANGKRIKRQNDESAKKKCASIQDSHAYVLGNDDNSNQGCVIEDTLYKFIENEVSSIQRNTKCERARNIQKAIAESLQFFLEEVEKIEPVFKVSELIQVGSYAEGTKIYKPDEFDFLAVVDVLSKEGTLVIDYKTNTWTTGSVTLSLRDKSEYNELNKFCEQGELQCFHGKSLRESFHGAIKFGTVFIKAVKNVYTKRVLKVRRPGVMPMFSPIEATFVGSGLIFPPVNDITLLTLTEVQFKTPNVLLEYELDGLKIGVDLSPAIRYHKIDDCIKPEKCASTELLEAIDQHGSVLLVGDKHGGFRITVTECEVKYMQEIIRGRHKLLYIFLKHVCDSVSLKPFTSYMLKQICLHHDTNCRSDDKTMTSCLGTIIEDMTMYCSNEEIPCVHNKDLNLSQSTLYSHSLDWHLRLHFLIAVRELWENSLKVKSPEGLKAVIQDALNKLSNKFSKFYDNRLVPLQNVPFDVVLSSPPVQDDRLFCLLCDGEEA